MGVISDKHFLEAVLLVASKRRSTEKKKIGLSFFLDMMYNKADMRTRYKMIRGCNRE